MGAVKRTHSIVCQMGKLKKHLKRFGQRIDARYGKANSLYGIDLANGPDISIIIRRIYGLPDSYEFERLPEVEDGE